MDLNPIFFDCVLAFKKAGLFCRGFYSLLGIFN